ILGAAAFYGYDWWTNGRFVVSTDDAYVGANAATIAPKITGYIKSVAVTDNSQVKAGDPLVVLDDADYRIALQQAEAQISRGQPRRQARPRPGRLRSARPKPRLPRPRRPRPTPRQSSIVPARWPRSPTRPIRPSTPPGRPCCRRTRRPPPPRRA